MANKPMYEVTESWFFQAKEDAEIAREQALQIEAMDGHIQQLEIIIKSQNEILEKELGMVPVMGPEQMEEVTQALIKKHEDLKKKERELNAKAAGINALNGDFKEVN